MGNTKRQRKKYENPRFSLSKPELDAELKLLGDYGLRNKKELRRHHSMLSKYRTLARKLLARAPEDRHMLEKQILSKLIFLKVIAENSNLDNVLSSSIENILDRRLQTQVFKKGLSKTLPQARQLITHGHIIIRGKKVTSPSYLVTSEEEQNIKCTIPITVEDKSASDSGNA